ncbi:hypothetical protein ACFFMR_23475 [Micromonospora andamanensis]|uniref:Uncharacterized protein n=1 Tax=Micromonospora andamanensis TaxID=1287068 RepID=A0ABQ4HUD5_9ACTN|nr:hypothetical protein Van01_24510 [Micromonospora andamanensis]
MGRVGTVVAVAGALGVAAARATRTAVSRQRAWRAGPPHRWQVVTVDRPPEQVLPSAVWPEPLRRLDGAVEVTVARAPGGRGTELAARARPHAAWPGLSAHLLGDDPGLLVRRTLWQVKQLAETGEVLRADRAPGERGPVDRPPR